MLDIFWSLHSWNKLLGWQQIEHKADRPVLQAPGADLCLHNIMVIDYLFVLAETSPVGPASQPVGLVVLLVAPLDL